MGDFLRTLLTGAVWRWCRSCGEPIERRDPFGLSEGVCAPCRDG
jgi:hypothetical protein